MLFDTGSTLTFNFNIYKKDISFKMLYQFFCKTICPSTIEAPPYSQKSLFKQTWIYTTRECFNRSIFFMVYGFHPPLPLPWIMILTKLNSVYLNMYVHNCRHIRLNCFWKEKIYKDVFFIFLVKIAPTPFDITYPCDMI